MPLNIFFKDISCLEVYWDAIYTLANYVCSEGGCILFTEMLFIPLKTMFVWRVEGGCILFTGMLFIPLQTMFVWRAEGGCILFTGMLFIPLQTMFVWKVEGGCILFTGALFIVRRVDVYCLLGCCLYP